MRNVWQCDVCKGLFDTKEKCEKCEERHVRGVSIYSAAYAKEMEWPKTIVAVSGYGDRKAKYKFAEEV